ncbi:integral membrane sensor signal transduction histidine kinase [Alkaliphilus metalliredigens QYMF]|uniref:histidine kinase n=1 Tax=Alkaliphilus metalliredigens (strain QYMF) TaxID=293826 RepID=A6TT48_ALKMQ|nr:ATP-binding protein [Alkaliphilus metalliredigens]ABR49366.1 integral membrane sensor signal transduction histidine kinase [Alkaliphilus metalliredigens QYMF]
MKEKIKQLYREVNSRIVKLVLVAIIVMGTLFGLSLGSYQHYRETVIKSQQENILNLVTTVSAQLEIFFNEKDDYLKEIITETQFKNQFIELTEGKTDNITLVDLLYRTQGKAFTALELIDVTGGIIKVYTDEETYQYRQGQDLQQALMNREDVYFVDSEIEQTINIIHPIKIEGELHGFIRMKLDSKYIYDVYIVDYRLQETGYMSVKDNLGRLLLHPSNESIGGDVVEVRQQQYPNYDWTELESIVKKQMEQETGVGLYHSIWPGDNTRVQKINGYTPSRIGDTFLIINFSIDYDETIVGIEKIRDITIVISIMLILVCIVIIIYIYKVEVNRSNLEIEARYFNQLREKNALLMHQSRFAAMGEMLATIAHQLKQPLNTLKLSLYNIEDYHTLEEDDPAYLQDLVGSTHCSIERMAKTIDDFKFFFKPQDKNVAFNLYEAIQFAIDLNLATINYLEIKTDIQGDKALKIKGESNIFSQVILNLVNNAIDAMKDNKGIREIKIVIHEGEKDVQVTIEDNGGGMPKEIVDRIFQPYVSTKGDQGTGLGLYISKTILKEKFKGDISIINIKNGVKAKITLYKEEKNRV